MLTDEEKQKQYQEKQAELEQEGLIDPITGDRGDPYRNVRDTDQNGQYDYMEGDRFEKDKTR